MSLVDLPPGIEDKLKMNDAETISDLREQVRVLKGQRDRLELTVMQISNILSGRHTAKTYPMVNDLAQKAYRQARDIDTQ